LELRDADSRTASSRCTTDSDAGKKYNRNLEGVKVEVNCGSENIAACDEEEPDSGKRTNDSILGVVMEKTRVKREKNRTPPRRHSASGSDASMLGLFSPERRAARKSVVEIPSGLGFELFGGSPLVQNIEITINKSLADSLGSKSRHIIVDLKADFLS